MNNYNKCSNCNTSLLKVDDSINIRVSRKYYLFGLMSIIEKKCYNCNQLLYYTKYILPNNHYISVYCLIDNKYIDKQFSLLIDVISSKYCLYNQQDILNEYNNLPEYFKMQELLLTIKLMF